MSVVHLIVATRSSNTGKIIKEMPGSVASGTHCRSYLVLSNNDPLNCEECVAGVNDV